MIPKVDSRLKVGDKIEVNKKIQTITSITKNVDGNPIVMWSSKQFVGGCTPSVWEEWKSGVNMHKRRGQASSYELYKYAATRRADSRRLS